jgi:CheY-like chemotaxis protein
MARPTVLIIEDNEMDMKLFRALIEIDGYNVLEVKDAESGIEMALEYSPNLVLMDLRLPGIDGLEASCLMKEHEALSNIPIIIVTSYPDIREEKRAKKAGCEAFLVKPVDTRSFARTITSVMST